MTFSDVDSRVIEKELKTLTDKTDICFANFDDDKLVELIANEVLNSIVNEEIYELWKANCPL